jgi:integrase/recombinase XerD
MEPLLALWDTQPAQQFSLFVRTQEFARISRRAGSAAPPKPLSSDSVQVYVTMFGKFVRWMVRHGCTFSTLTPGDLHDFISAGENGKRELNSAIARRYLRLLERCYLHLNVSPNPAQIALLREEQTRGLAQDAAMVVLSTEQAERFAAALPDVPPKVRRGALWSGWKRRRDRAMQLVMMCAGLKVAEVIGLHSDEIEPTPELDGAHRIKLTPADKHDTSYKHETLLPAFAAAEVLRWLAERQAMKLPGPLLFPANPRGEPLDKATVYRQVKATFERAGIAVPRSGGRTLRNTFAVRGFSEGAPASEMVERLGLALERSTQPYARLGGATPAKPE